MIGRYERYEGDPDFERLRALLRACGFALGFRLANVDATDHDRVLIERELGRTPAERLQRGFAAGRAFGSLAERAGGGA